MQPAARLSLLHDDRLRIEGHPNAIDITKLGRLLGVLRLLGLWTHPILIQKPPTGHAIHYAGTLPMRVAPQRYQCDPAGRLAGTQSVYIADSASFADLPAKNMGLTMMANAMRVAGAAARGLGARGLDARSVHP